MKTFKQFLQEEIEQSVVTLDDLEKKTREEDKKKKKKTKSVGWATDPGRLLKYLQLRNAMEN